ncbi:alpha/beta fold hydrolase [Nocardioides dongkuii]|uniref:alpha/beta fold hydrolase n=1 Tax=Nocardioides dongkuii TaxID=2760089 RepID=UPI001878D2FF|nr:alpha/beta hydrolase [Nocardioides dongkuii]
MPIRSGLRALSSSAALAGVLLVLLPASAPVTASAPAAGRPVSDRPAAGAQVARAPLPALRWGRCRSEGHDSGSGRAAGIRQRTTCADIWVPLDYDRPHGARTRLHLARVAAARPGARIGTLFVNPGGPGGPSAEFAGYAAHLLGDRVQARFDVVGIDPRGTGGSGEVSCRGPRPRSLPAYPRTTEEIAAQLRSDARVRRACRRAATPLTDHASTADNARDMELVRRALRERRISYLGVSYGTYLGATYAAMFPDRIRAMVVDGVLDPVAWSTGEPGSRDPFSTRVRSGAGSHEALMAALAECARVGEQRCPIAAAPQETWERVLARAAARPIRIEGERVSDRDLISLVTSLLYDASAVPLILEYVDELDRAASAPAGARRSTRLLDLHRRVATVHERRAAGGPWTAPAGRRVGVQSPAVMCSDSRNPDRPRAWVRAAARADREAPGFGPLWTWVSSVCAREGIGSGADSYRGPWRTRTAYPLLVVGNSHDPATPISGARRVHGLFAGSRLVTYDGWGHGALGTGRCARRTMAGYLVGRELPAEGKVCSAPPLFPKSPRG